MRSASLAIVVAVLTACSPFDMNAASGRHLGAGERWLPVANWQSAGGPLLCAGGGFIGDWRLRGSPEDPRVTWLVQPDGVRRELAWPVGYSARFMPWLEVLDETGTVVAHEGSLASGGCPTADPEILQVKFLAGW